MADPSVVIDIAAEYTGKKAFDKAAKSTSSLEKSVKSLGKAFVGVFAAQKVLAYGKASVKAFAEDDAAAKSLAQTLKNLGLAYGSNAGTINGFINRLEMSTGVLDDELRPALDRILRATNDVSRSQELLTLALDISAGTGKSVTQVSQSLQKAYLGQTQALGRLGVGLTKAELSTSSFEDITLRLNELFAGQATRAANSYQGSLNKLQVAANNAKETIGKGLVDALGTLSNSQNVDGTVSAIDRIAESIANATTGFAKFIKVSKEYLGTGLFLDKAEKASLQATKAGTRFTTPMTISSQDTQKADNAAAKKAEAAAKKREKQLEAARLKSVKAEQNKAKLTKAAASLELQKISIAAALKGKISEEERIRLLLMQAIEDENGKKAEELAKKLEEIQKKNKEISEQLVYIQGASNPFDAWVTSLDAAAIILGKMPDLLDASGVLTGRGKKVLPTGDGLPEDGQTSIFTPDMTPTEIADTATAAADMAVAAANAAHAAVLASEPIVTAISEAATAATNIADVITNDGSTVAYTGSSSIFNPYATTPGSSAGFGTQAPTIIVNNNGTTIMQDEFVKAVGDALIVSNTNGQNNYRPGAILTDG